MPILPTDVIFFWRVEKEGKVCYNTHRFAGMKVN